MMSEKGGLPVVFFLSQSQLWIQPRGFHAPMHHSALHPPFAPYGGRGGWAGRSGHLSLLQMVGLRLLRVSCLMLRWTEKTSSLFSQHWTEGVRAIGPAAYYKQASPLERMIMFGDPSSILLILNTHTLETLKITYNSIASLDENPKIGPCQKTKLCMVFQHGPILVIRINKKALLVLPLICC